ncbi:MAG: leucine-rich repeat domain-containing protein [Bacteroidales bacterium]|nr:leucine-rich repeat domain-containing protein [Candidatus Physcocola equi]
MGLFQSIKKLFGGSTKEVGKKRAEILIDPYSSIEELISKRELSDIGELYVKGQVRTTKSNELFDYVKTICEKYERLYLLDLSGIVGMDEVKENALCNCNSLKKVIFPVGVRNIHNEALKGCKNLQSVVLPEGLERIMEGVFAECPKLSDVKLPQSLFRIGIGVFEGDDSLTEISLPCRVESIGTSALNCKNLKTIIVEPHNPSYIAIDNVLFSRNGSALVRYAPGKENSTFVIPDQVAKIGEEAFWGCGNLNEVTLTGNVVIVAKKAFMACTALDHIDIPSRVEKIDENAFENCTNLTVVNFSNGITSIGNQAFKNCKKLKRADLPMSLVKIGDEVFSNCESMTYCDIPSSVDYIGKDVFKGTQISK